MNVRDIRTIVNRKRTELTVLQGQLKDCEKDIDSLETRIADLSEARTTISEASRVTQEQFQGFVEQLVTLAIQSVFQSEDYRFIVDFDLKSNRTQINLLVQQGNKEPYIPEDEQGGALLDIISFALRIVMWSLEKPRSRNVLIFDEPFRWTGDLTERAALMMKEISKKLGIQIIIVTHDSRLIEIADRSWKVERSNGGASTLSIVGNADPIKVTRKRIKL